MRINWKVSLVALVGACALLGQSAFADPPRTSRYYQDSKVEYNDDQTTDTFGLVSVVSCILNKMHPEYNAGLSYVAWLKYGICDANSSSTGSSLPYEKATIYPTYNAATGILNVKMWLEGYQDDDSSGVRVYTPQYIWVNVDVSAGPTIAPPLGRWTMQFCSQTTLGTGSGASDPASCDSGFGYGAVTPDTMSVFTKFVRNNAVKDSKAGTASYSIVGGEVVSGRGQFTSYNAWDTGHAPVDMTYAFAFSGDNYHLKGIDNVTSSPVSDICTSRNISTTTPLFNNWSGWLYNSSTGDAIDLAGGFNLKLATGPVTDWSKTGWVGYWGPWFPEKDNQGRSIPALVDGQTVYSNGRANNDVPYTYKKALGSLQKTTISIKEFSEVDGVRYRLSLNLTPNQALGDITAGSSGGGNYLVYWDNAHSRFVSEGKYGSDNQAIDSGTGNIGNFTIANLITAKQMNVWGNINNSNVGINFSVGKWDYSSGSGVMTALTPNVANGAKANQTSWDDIYPGTPESGTADLANDTILDCYGDQNQCPTMLSAHTPQSHINWGHDGSLTPVSYRWDNASGNLIEVASGLVVDSAAQRDVGPLFVHGTSLTSYACQYQQGGVGARGFFTPNNTTNPTAWSFTVGGTCTNNAWQTAGTFYRWNTNTSNPNWPSRAFIVRQSDGKRPVFDKQINLTYTPATGSLAGKVQNLTYNGGGQFWVPNTCYNKSTRVEQSCSNGNDQFYASNYDIPFTTAAAGKVTRTDDPSVQYLVKYLGRSFIYGLAPTGACNALTPPTNTTIPTAFGWSDPHAVGSSNFMGAWQTPSASPLYVDGVQQ
jgi:hypothetical protein